MKKILLLTLIIILALSILNCIQLRQAYDTVQEQREAIQMQADIIDRLQKELDSRTKIRYELAGYSNSDTSYLVSELIKALDNHQYYVEHPYHSKLNLSNFESVEQFVEWNQHWVEVYEQVLILLEKNGN